MVARAAHARPGHGPLGPHRGGAARSWRCCPRPRAAPFAADFAVVSVCPAFTMGPDDPVGAPANKLIESLITRKLRFTLPVGFGCLDVRDFATGVLAAAERGRSGRRYLLSGHNVTTNQLLEQAAAVAGVPVPRSTPPRLLIQAIAVAVEMIRKVRGSLPWSTAASCRSSDGTPGTTRLGRARSSDGSRGRSSRPSRTPLAGCVRRRDGQGGPPFVGCPSSAGGSPLLPGPRSGWPPQSDSIDPPRGPSRQSTTPRSSRGHWSTSHPDWPGSTTP